MSGSAATSTHSGPDSKSAAPASLSTPPKVAFSVPGLAAPAPQTITPSPSVQRRSLPLPNDSLDPLIEQAPDFRAVPVPGWRENVHLNGTVYYYHPERCIVTSCDVAKPGVADRIIAALDKFAARVRRGNLVDEEKWDIEHVAYHLGDPSKVLFYHVNLTRRKKLMLIRVGRELTLETRPESELWEHYAQFPMHHTNLMPGLEWEFLNAMTWGAGDRVFERKETIFPYTDRVCQRLVEVYHTLTDAPLTISRADLTGPTLWHIATAMIEVQRSRERHGWGTHDAHRSRDVAVPKLAARVRAFEGALMIVLFSMHSMYRRRLQSCRVKGTVFTPDFQKLMQSLVVEWADSNLLATVFVSANVAFLAVPGINGLQRTASLASSLLGMMSILIGVHHVWRHRPKLNAEPKEAEQYLQHVDHLGEVDLTVTACFLSMPIVALLWSVISFSIAVSAFCIQGSTDLRSEVFLEALIGIISLCGCSIIFFFWHIWQSPSPVAKIKERKESHDASGGEAERPNWLEKAATCARAYWAWYRLSSNMPQTKSNDLEMVNLEQRV